MEIKLFSFYCMKTILIVKIRVFMVFIILKEYRRWPSETGKPTLTEISCLLNSDTLKYFFCNKCLIKKCCLLSLTAVVWNRGKKNVLVTSSYALFKNMFVEINYCKIIIN